MQVDCGWRGMVESGEWLRGLYSNLEERNDDSNLGWEHSVVVKSMDSGPSQSGLFTSRWLQVSHWISQCSEFLTYKEGIIVIPASQSALRSKRICVWSVPGTESLVHINVNYCSLTHTHTHTLTCTNAHRHSPMTFGNEVSTVFKSLR